MDDGTLDGLYQCGEKRGNQDRVFMGNVGIRTTKCGWVESEDTRSELDTVVFRLKKSRCK